MKLTLEERVLMELFRSSKTLKKVLQDEAGATEMWALATLATHPEITMSDLAKILGIAPSTTTALANRLIAHGYAERVVSDDNRRTVRLRLSKAGAAYFTAASQRKQLTLTHLFREVSRPDLATFYTVLSLFNQRTSQK